MRKLVSAAWRARLLAQPGISATPRCPCCGGERDAGDFVTSGRCRFCVAGITRDAQMQAELERDGQPKPAPRTGQWTDDDRRDYE